MCGIAYKNTNRRRLRIKIIQNRHISVLKESNNLMNIKVAATGMEKLRGIKYMAVFSSTEFPLCLNIFKYTHGWMLQEFTIHL